MTQPASRRRRPLVVRVLVAALAAVLLGPWLGAALVAGTQAASVTADTLGLTSRPADDVAFATVDVDGVVADRYGPAAGAVVVLVPGAAPDGRRDARVVDLARSIARQGREVLVPELDVYGERLTVADIERIVALVVDRSQHGDPVVLMGISFGGSLALLAAADERLSDRLAMVATFGAYTDLLGVVEAAVTGGSDAAGEWYPWLPDPRAPEVVREQLLVMLDDDERQMASEVLDGARSRSQAPAGVRAVADLLEATDGPSFADAADRLPASVTDQLGRFSPVHVAEQVEVDVVAMHARDDPVIPYAELVRLGEAMPDARLVTVASFTHVDLALGAPATWPRAVFDLWSVWRFAAQVLDATR